MATESARGPPRGRGRKEAWWEEGAGEAESAAPGSGVERSGDGTQRKAAGSAGSAVGAGIAAAATRERSVSWHSSADAEARWWRWGKVEGEPHSRSRDGVGASVLFARTMRWVGTWGWVRVRPPIFPSHQPERCVQRPHVNPRLPKYILPLISSIYFYILDDRLNKIKIYTIYLKI